MVGDVAHSGSRTRRVRRSLQSVAEATIILASLLYVVTAQLWALLAWELVALCYIVVGLALIWRGGATAFADAVVVRELRRWAWVLPVASSAVGAHSAVLALVARSQTQHTGENVLLAVAACVGVVLSWSLLSVGFAQIYLAIDASVPPRQRIGFPGPAPDTTLNYVYFAFTISTSFATSDALVRSLRTRRVVLLHSVLCFFYNALVLAVAFQILQQSIGG